MTSPLFMIPGFMLDETLWEDMVPALGADRTARSISLKGSATMADLIDRIAAVPSPGFVVVGFSMGGYIARAFANRYPERVDAHRHIAASRYA